MVKLRSITGVSIPWAERRATLAAFHSNDSPGLQASSIISFFCLFVAILYTIVFCFVCIFSVLFLIGNLIKNVSFNFSINNFSFLHGGLKVTTNNLYMYDHFMYQQTLAHFCFGWILVFSAASPPVPHFASFALLSVGCLNIRQ